MAAAPYPARGSCGLSLIYPLARLKLPVLAASKAVNLPTCATETAGVAASTSLRRSRKAGAARMDAG
ncbi:hypothetical protein B7R62_00995 [Klebsiella pneumoniae]|nr:hypothetical protein B7R62_00995 [Klebsiella pneumoniae]